MKNIGDHRKDKGIKISSKNFGNIISDRSACTMYDNVGHKSGDHVISRYPVKKVWIDRVGVAKKYKTVKALDHFSGKTWDCF